MILWILMGALTALVLGLLLRPLLRPATPAAAQPDLAIYRDQLDELARDRAAGRLGEREAEAATREVERRLLAAADRAPHPATANRPARAWAWALILLLPLGGVGLYLWHGQPDLSAQPLAERGGEARMHQALLQREVELRQILVEDPTQGDAWQELGVVLTLQGRPEDAAAAYRRALAAGASPSQANAGLAEALIIAAGGTVGPDARQALAAALQADPADPLALYYVGHALEQDGRLQQALDLWVELARAAPVGTPWRQRVLDDIARVAGKLGLDPATLDLSPQP